jgi:hypothetical protein
MFSFEGYGKISRLVQLEFDHRGSKALLQEPIYRAYTGQSDM